MAAFARCLRRVQGRGQRAGWAREGWWRVSGTLSGPRVQGSHVWTPANSVWAPLTQKCELVLRRLGSFLFGAHHYSLAIRYLKEICPVVSSLCVILVYTQSSKQVGICFQCNFEYKVLQFSIYKGEDNISFIFMASENTGQRNYHLPHTVHWQTLSDRLKGS